MFELTTLQRLIIRIVLLTNYLSIGCVNQFLYCLNRSDLKDEELTEMLMLMLNKTFILTCPV